MLKYARKTLLTWLCVLGSSIGLSARATGQVLFGPDVRLNGAAGPVTVAVGSKLVVTVSMNPAQYTAYPVDWWVAASTPFGLYYLNASLAWTPASGLDDFRPVHQGGLFDLQSAVVLDSTALPAGTYTFYFGVDTLNGSLDPDVIYDSAIVATITRNTVEAVCGINDDMTVSLSTITEAGLALVRTTIPWDQIEWSAKGVYDFTECDTIVNRYSSAGIKMLWLLSYGNFPLYNVYAPTTSVAITGFKNYAVALLERYKSKDITWNLYNEPDNTFFEGIYLTPQQYYDLASQVIPAMRSADPSCKIYGPATGHANLNYAKDLFDRGFLSLIDGFDIHGYTFLNPESLGGNIPESNLKYFRDMKQLIHKYHPNMPIVITEEGYNGGVTPEDEYPDPDEHAQMVARIFLFNTYQDIEFLNLFALKDYIPDDGSGRCGLIKVDGTSKTAYYAVKTLLNNFKGYTYLRRISTQNTSDYILVFKNSAGDEAYACWTTNVAHDVTLPIGNGTVKIIALTGTESDITVSNETHTFSINRSPTYLIKTLATDMFLNSFWKPNKQDCYINADQPQNIDVDITNPLTTSLSVTCRVKVGETQIGTVTEILAANETKIVSIPVVYNPSGGSYSDADIYVETSRFGVQAAPITIFVTAQPAYGPRTARLL